MLSKREIIILSLAGIAAIYAVATFLPFGSSPTKTPPEHASFDVAALKKEALSSLQSLRKSDRTTELSALVNEKWANDLFFTPSPEKESKKTQAPPPEVPEFTYTGYIEMGKVRVAVINEFEYEQGEELRESGYKLHFIAPEYAVIRKKDTGYLIKAPFLDIEEHLTSGDPRVPAAPPTSRAQE